MTHPFYHLPRLYLSQELIKGKSLVLAEEPSHYLRNVLRKTIADRVRVFNSQNGEWLAQISGGSKKSITLTIEEEVRHPKIETCEIHLIFSPLKKDRNDMLIEKAVELGVTHLHPSLFSRTIVRDIKPDRIKAQLIEATEQCERLSPPSLAPLKDLKKLLSEWSRDIPVFAAIERQETISLLDATKESIQNKTALLVGPEGGLTVEEIEILTSQSFITPVSLGPRILRAETAVFYGLSLLTAHNS
ncbi:MAG: 16S rRNA (uracil(1498)-N(3))-methyltransferase [Alphaproteobacteria bacterium]|nr:16S rRNA (uracil(1498)-N(3))-methyltransferase [Alphaproteobacteria bacterium]